ncbi:UNVERIFIED_CONTAM: hypothetical protein Scaly_0484700 [Sesamum calycinum]|uniref:SWIM-type domain-containing protein n=1 Tax=Sesamum calycinum TaxID=2727403 RepID=A0AAW2RPI6_9LAMI
MTGIIDFDSTRILLNFEKLWLSRAYEDCILDMTSGGCVMRHDPHKLYLVKLEYAARMVDSKREFVSWPNSEYFTIRLHHSGQLCEFGRRVYVGGKIDHFDYCHVDEMSLIELTEMAKTLQIDTEHVTFFYSRNGINDCNSIAMMSTDLHTLELVNYVDGDRIVGIFIDHGHGMGHQVKWTVKLGIGDNESDFGIEVNWGGVGVFNSNLDNGDPQFEVGLCFPDTQSFRDAVRQHSIINARDVVFTKNDKNKVQVKCKHDTCKWVERVSAANSKWLANKYKDKLRTDPKWPVDSMMSVMQKECKLLFSKFQMYRAKEKVAKMSAGSEEQQYGLLWRFCVMHLYNNFKLAHKGLGLKMMLWKAAKATRVVDFEKIMNELRGKDLKPSNGLQKDLLHSGPDHTLDARSRPIVDMLETIRMMLMKRVYVKRDQIKKHKGKLTPNIQKLIEELKKKSMEYIAHWNGKDQFEVESCYGDKHNLHLGEKTCSCRKWQLTGIPCAHAISGMYFMGYKPEDYVHEYYHKSNFLRVYNHLMMPLLGPEEWPHSDRPTLLPPISERMPGRPKKQDRRKTLDEMKNKKDEVTNCGEKRGKLGRQGLVMTCKTCHVAGHKQKNVSSK